jgi:hypothetical protein
MARRRGYTGEQILAALRRDLGRHLHAGSKSRSRELEHCLLREPGAPIFKLIS